MAKSTKKQIGFYADPDIEEYLESLNAGVKTRTINAALRAWKENRSNFGPVQYKSQLHSLSAWLRGLRVPITVTTTEGKSLELANLIDRFLHQDSLRPASIAWSQMRKERRENDQCETCHSIKQSSELIETESRGLICRECFSHYPEKMLEEDLDRYGSKSMGLWWKSLLRPGFRGERGTVSEEFANEEYEKLPNYVKAYLTVEQYKRVIERCIQKFENYF